MMDAGTFDAVVVGAGVIGASVALELASGGFRVVLLDRGRAGLQGSTARSGGIMRAYDRDDAARALAVRSVPVLKRRMRAWGVPFERRGVAIVRKQHRGLHSVTTAMRSAGIDVQLFAGRDAAVETGVRLGENECVLVERASGVADPVAYTRALVAAAARRGVVVMEGMECVGLRVEDGRVIGVRHRFGGVSSPVVVLCCNTESAGLLPAWAASPDTDVRRISLFAFASTSPTLPLAAYIDDCHETYFRSVDSHVVQVGLPAAPAGEPLNQSTVDRAYRHATGRFPDRDIRGFLGTRAAFEVYVSAEEPATRQHPDIRGLYITRGPSGRGFRTSAAVGADVAEQITSAHPPSLGENCIEERVS